MSVTTSPIGWPGELMRALAALAVFGSAEGTASGGEPDVTATMQCERAPDPGRVRCSVEARARTGRALSWADVAILELPDFASALKGRIGAEGVVARDPSSEKWAFGLVARKTGQGEVRARVRMVVCDALTDGGTPSQRCHPATLDVRATIQVG
jgi:hypothetical protein